MAKPQEPITGVLNALHAKYWDALSPEEKERHYFSSFPDRAYDEILNLRKLCAEYQHAADEYSKIVSESLAEFKKASNRKFFYFKLVTRLEKRLSELERYSASEKKRLAGLDTKSAHEANEKRAAIFRKGLSEFVVGRVKENHLLTAQELANEISGEPWATKNKRGERYSKSYLRSVVGPMVRKARRAARKGEV